MRLLEVRELGARAVARSIVETWRLIDERQQLNANILSTESERIKGQLRKKNREKDRERREVKRSLKLDKKKWLESIATEAAKAARSQHMMALYGLRKKLCRARTLERYCMNREQPTNPIKPEEEAGFEFVELIEEIAVSELTSEK